MTTPTESNVYRNFQKGIGPVFFIGRLLGVISYSNVISWWRGSSRNLKFRWFSCPVTISCCVSALSTIQFFIRICSPYLHSSSNANVQAGLHPDSIENIASKAVAFFDCHTYCYILANSKVLLKLTNEFMETYTSLVTVDPGKDDSRFPTFGLCLSSFLLGIYTVEVLLYDVQWFQINDIGDKPLLERFFIRYGIYPLDILPYHPLLGVLVVALGKMKQYLGIFREVLTILLCQALTIRFRGVNTFIRNRIAVRLANGAMKIDESPGLTQISQQSAWKGKLEPVPWESIREDILSLCQLTKKVSEFVSPLMITSYCFAIYVIMMQIFQWLNPYSESTIERSIYMYFSYLTFTLRVIFLTYFASNVYHSTDEIAKTIQQCPSFQFTKSAERLERLVESHPASIALFNTFVITRKFFLPIVSFVCTTEIVLLQTAEGGRHRNGRR